MTLLTFVRSRTSSQSMFSVRLLLARRWESPSNLELRSSQACRRSMTETLMAATAPVVLYLALVRLSVFQPSHSASFSMPLGQSCCSFDRRHLRKALIDPSARVEMPYLSCLSIPSSILRLLQMASAVGSVRQSGYLSALSSRGLASLSFAWHLQMLLGASIGT